MAGRASRTRRKQRFQLLQACQLGQLLRTCIQASSCLMDTR